MLTTLKTPAATKWTWSGAGYVRESPSEKQLAATNRTLVFLRARYYDTATGEFISRDPLGYVDGMSLYRAYFAINGVDPQGLFDWVVNDPPVPIKFADVPQGHLDEVKAGLDSYGSIEATEADFKLYQYYNGLIGSSTHIHDLWRWNSLPGRLLRHYAGNTGEKFSLTKEDVKGLITETPFGAEVRAAIFDAQHFVIPKFGTVVGFRQKDWGSTSVTTDDHVAYNLALGKFRHTFAGIASKTCAQKEIGNFFGNGPKVCKMVFSMKILDLYDFELASKKTVFGKLIDNGIMNDFDLARLHHVGLMREFEVEGKASLAFEFDCEKGTLLTRKEIADKISVGNEKNE